MKQPGVKRNAYTGRGFFIYFEFDEMEELHLSYWFILDFLIK